MVPSHTRPSCLTSDEDLKSLLDDATFQKLVRFRLQKKDENWRECQSCSHMQLGNRRTPAMTCERCAATYCFFHSNAHPNTRSVATTHGIIL
jgi:hypothetical protein